VPRQFNRRLKKVARGVDEGAPGEFPVVDFSAALFYGSYHDVDSSEMSFKLAARLAFKKGIMEANPVLLEPIMTVEVSVPEEYLGDVMGDFNSRRGRILSASTARDTSRSCARRFRSRKCSATRSSCVR
jgi:elongation factor G